MKREYDGKYCKLEESFFEVLNSILAIRSRETLFTEQLLLIMNSSARLSILSYDYRLRML